MHHMRLKSCLHSVSCISEVEATSADLGGYQQAHIRFEGENTKSEKRF